MSGARWLRSGFVAAGCSAALATPGHAAAQSYLERTPRVDGGWVGLPGRLYVDASDLFRTSAVPGDGLVDVPVYRGLLALPRDVLVGGTLAASARPGGADVLEIFARLGRPAANEEAWAFGASAAYTDPAGSLDGELSAWKALGPLRVVATLRGFSDFDGRGVPRGAVLGGLILPLAPGQVPVALAGDVGQVVGDGSGSEPVWSAGLHAGVSFTPFTVALQVGNARDPGFQGAVIEGGRVRFGLAVVAPVPLGRFLGWYAPREQALRSVQGGVDPTPGMVRASISSYAYWPLKLEVAAGTVVEWVNEDPALHTVSADDGSFDSGGLEQGARWRARFDEPGTYPYHCGPHPFMQAVVVVR